MSDCFICKKPLDENKIRTVKAKGVKTLLDRAIAKNDEVNEQFLRTVSEVTLHVACYCYYVDNRTDNVVRRRSSSSSSLSSVSEAPEPDFDFKNNCFICAKAVQDPSNSRTSRQPRVCIVRNESTKTSIMDLINQRSDDVAMDITNRIANIPSLVAVGARYHNNCSKQLYSKKWSVTNKKDERKNNIDAAMADVFSYLHENSEECQFFMTDLMKSITGEYIPQKRTIIERLKAKYKDEIVFFNESGHDCIVCFKGFIYKIISNKPPSHKKNDVREERLQIVRDAAAIILEDIRSQYYETKEYPPSDSFLKDVNTLIPETLSVLLKGIICQSKRKSLNAAERKCASIAHSIIAATRPASFLLCYLE
ncbi:unnamed protein product [Colias eurytheme]|nr:unnamed protein product [Colias eurytheme]